MRKQKRKQEREQTVPNWGYAVMLAAILLLALELRLFGIEWGLPAADHPSYSYHPDEAATLVWAEWLAKGEIISRQFVYGGTFYFSMLNASITFGRMFSDSLGGINLLADSILFGRLVLTVLALITIWLVYRVGALLHDRTTGVVAALFLAVSPAHIVWAQRLRVDEMAAFCTVLVVFFAARLLRDKKPARRLYVYAGMAIGLALATRIPLVVFAVAPVAAHVLRQRKQLDMSFWKCLFDRELLVLYVAAVGALVVLSFHSFLHFDKLLEGMRVTMTFESSPFPDAVDRGPRLLQYGFLLLPQALGVPIFVFGLAGVAWACMRRRKEDMVVLLSVIPYFLLLSFASWVVVRYTLPLVPLLALTAAWFVSEICVRYTRARVGSYVAMALAVMWTLASDLAYLRVAAGMDIRDVAANWIVEHTDPQARIAVVWGYDGDHYFNPVIALPRVKVPWINSVTTVDAPLDPLAPQHLVVNEYSYKNMDRLGDRHPVEWYRQFRVSLSASDYRLINEFKHRYEFLGVDFSWCFSAFDFSVVNPGIRIYARGGV